MANDHPSIASGHTTDPAGGSVLAEPPAQQMSCMEVWGASQLTAQSVRFSGLDAWVYSRPYAGAASGGDVVYASSCATGRITRLLLADVAGHGTAVETTSAGLRTLMRRFVNRLDQTELVRLLNQQFTTLSGQAVFATALVTTFFEPTRRLTVCNAGHPRPLVYRARRDEWTLMTEDGVAPGSGPRNVPLGILTMADYDTVDLELDEGDCVLAYTDALIEALDDDGEPLGERGLLRMLSRLRALPPSQLIGGLLAELTRRRADNLSTDDVTLLVVRAGAPPVRYSVVDRLRALGRLCLDTLRAIHPLAERPPLPDWHLANVGGAVIPALGRRWRKGA